jgi:hypothetical protein
LSAAPAVGVVDAAPRVIFDAAPEATVAARSTSLSIDPSLIETLAGPAL